MNATDQNGQDTGEHAYDYVIVGGGTAGSVLAARLSEDPDCRVCVIEGGPSDVGDERVLRLRNWINLLERSTTTATPPPNSRAGTRTSCTPAPGCWAAAPRTTR